MTARREKGKFWFSLSFCGDVHRLAECEGDSDVAVSLPRIISGSRGLVYPRAGGLREGSSSICRLRVNRTSDSSPSGDPRRYYIFIMRLLCRNPTLAPGD